MAVMGLTILLIGQRTTGRGDDLPRVTAGNPRNRGWLAGALVAATADATALIFACLPAPNVLK